MRTYINAYTSLNFGQNPPLTTELAALERLKNRCHHIISVDIDPIFFKLAGNKNMHNIMNEFEFRPERTIDYGVSCPWASKKYPYRPYNGENGVSTFSLLFLIGSFWYFHVTRTSIKAWMSLNFLKWDLTLAHWTRVSDCWPLGYLLKFKDPPAPRHSKHTHKKSAIDCPLSYFDQAGYNLKGNILLFVCVLLTLPDSFPPSLSWHQMLGKNVNVVLDHLCQEFML